MRNALVTAAGAGIGRAIASRLAAAGYRVFGCDLSAEALAGIEDMVGIVADISCPGDVTAMFDTIVARAGTLDLLVNNAGIGGPRAPLDEIEPEAWDETIAVNLNGMFYCMRAAAALMKAAKAGVIVNISTSSATHYNTTPR